MSLPSRIVPYAPICAAVGAARGVDCWLLLAIIDRESGGGVYLSPRGPGGVGDSGHGHGLGQIDDRTWAQWLSTHDWTDPEINIGKAGEILAANLSIFSDQWDPEACAIAAYNCGPAKVWRAILSGIDQGDKLAHVDAGTTGGNYVADVRRRRDLFKTSTP